MDKKFENKYSYNYVSRNDVYRNQIPFQNVIRSQNGIIPIAPMPNIVYMDTNYLNKKRDAKDISSGTAYNSIDNTKSKFEAN